MWPGSRLGPLQAASKRVPDKIDMLIDFAPKDIDLEKLKKLLERSIINAQKEMG